MKLGTKSLLFGVHQFLWHPITVARAWHFLFDRWPRGWEWLAIFVHDFGYWGCDNMDGEEGKKHPINGSHLAFNIMRFFHVSKLRAGQVEDLVRYHSQSLAEMENEKPSALCWPDKLSIKFDPAWFYLLRARLSGELKEYRVNAHISKDIKKWETDRVWLRWLRKKNTIRSVYYTYE